MEEKRETKKRRTRIRDIKRRNIKLHMRDRVKGVNRKNIRLNKKIGLLRRNVEKLRLQCAIIKEETLNKAISQLPKKQQLAVRACFQASKLTDMKCMRYTTEWIYECYLLQVKSKKVYKQLRRDKVLILPSPVTLSRYMKHLKSTYGFQSYVFTGLKVKTESMDPENRRGIFAINEVKLSEAVTFDRVNLKVEGFTDIEDYTPEHQKGVRGDHALVIMFQPFKGNFVQTVGCFLSRGSANGSVLHKIVLEGVALAEEASLFIDAVVTDGATWNRNMWKNFRISEKCVSAPHPCDVKRRLWFLSDYPHLAKSLRNFFIKFPKFRKFFTPDGGISLKH
ncbi:uncharacterized protein LOC122508805 isoform X1 [Leptopilina heterotoma]|uniref:uncharacterized protein LOC122508805 isoform X1 n=1 Tax=Leptopilina heterotoma TaxID=63436 RepID=UPI001CA960F7|nr:uncharacterized protein LOC122508805 isoform X1 [Leptopilina heterotoma]